MTKRKKSAPGTPPREEIVEEIQSDELVAAARDGEAEGETMVAEAPVVTGRGRKKKAEPSANEPPAPEANEPPAPEPDALEKFAKARGGRKKKEEAPAEPPAEEIPDSRPPASDAEVAPPPPKRRGKRNIIDEAIAAAQEPDRGERSASDSQTDAARVPEPDPSSHGVERTSAQDLAELEAAGFGDLDVEMTVNVSGDLLNDLPGRDDLDAPTISIDAVQLDQIARVEPVIDERKHLHGMIEALVFASDTPIRPKDIAGLTDLDVKQVLEGLAELREEYSTRGLHLEEVAGGWVFRTSPRYSNQIRELRKERPVRLTRAQVETLAIIAYRQPVTRPEIDDVRGVDSGPVLKLLLERDLVRILGKRDEVGRPLIYGTTNGFLEFFGLNSLKDLPTLREFTELTEESKEKYEEELGDMPAPPPPEPEAPAPPPVDDAKRAEYESMGEEEVAPSARQDTLVDEAELSNEAPSSDESEEEDEDDDDDDEDDEDDDDDDDEDDEDDDDDDEDDEDDEDE